MSQYSTRRDSFVTEPHRTEPSDTTSYGRLSLIRRVPLEIECRTKKVLLPFDTLSEVRTGDTLSRRPLWSGLSPGTLLASRMHPGHQSMLSSDVS